MSAAILRVSVALGVCAALINLLLWRQPIMEMANGHTWAFQVLYAMWFVVAWGVATGALTGLAIMSMWRRSPGRVSAAVAFVVGLFLTSAVCLVLYRGFTDAQFMHDAMSGLHPEEVNAYSTSPAMNDPGTDLDMGSAPTQSTRLNLVGVLTPNFIAVALSVLYAFGGTRQGMHLSTQTLRPGVAPRAPEYAYLVGIGVVALLIGGAAWQFTGSQSEITSGPAMTASGVLGQADRTVQIETNDDLRFDPSALTVRQGETIAFVVSNPGSIAHEFVVGSADVQQAHEQQMEMMPYSMADDSAFALDLPPGATKTLLYTFDHAGTLLFGCHVSGHYQAGMLGTIAVIPS